MSPTSRNPGRRPAVRCGCDPQLMGEIKGKVEIVLSHLEKADKRQDAMDSRLRSVERQGAIAGAVSGLLMALGINLAGWYLKKH